MYGRRPAAGNPLYDTGSNLKAFYNKESSSQDHHIRDRGGQAPRDRGGERDRDRDRERDRERERDHDRDRRRRSRSRSAERRVRQRRSDSPFSVFYDNWKKFKQAERVCIHYLIFIMV